MLVLHANKRRTAEGVPKWSFNGNTKMRFLGVFRRYVCHISRRRETQPISPTTDVIAKQWFARRFSYSSSHLNDEEDPKMKEFLDYLENLKNYEKSGVPEGAGTESDDGFDMGRMKRLLKQFRNPQSKFKVVHIAGTKGKGSTAAFLSTILREAGYSVGCYTSPHFWSIRERMSLGRKGDPVSAETISGLFHQVKDIIDHSKEMENGKLSHFEVLTALAFTLFALENVEIAVIEAGLGGARDATNVFSCFGTAASVITTIGEEHMAALGGSLESIAMAKSGIMKHGRPVVLGGPFKPHIERILRDKASSMSSPVVLASDPVNKSAIKSFAVNNGQPCQSCDIRIQVDQDLQLFIELLDVKLLMLGSHQLQNAVTATCASLCLRDQGWKISDESIRSGLERTSLVGRSQFLTSEQVKAIGHTGVQILVDGAHTKESARSLADTIELTHPNAEFALVVAMASDKDHLGFAKQLLSGSRRPKGVVLTEVGIAGDRARSTPASVLRDVWIQAGINDGDIMLGMSGSVEDSIKMADEFLKGDEPSLIVVTGSLHIVSQALALVQ